MGSLQQVPWEEILVRLPELDLLRFRAVCKEWNEVISSESFARYHGSAQVGGPATDSWLMCFVNDHGSNHNPLLMNNPRVTSRWVTTRLELTEGDIEIGDGYGGLTCMDEGDPIAFNLTTRTWKRFPVGFKLDQLLFHDGQWIAVSLEERTIHTMQESAGSWMTRRATLTRRRTLSSFGALSGHLFCVVTALNGMLNLEECSMSNWSWESYLFARLENGEQRKLFSVHEFVNASTAPPLLLNVAGKLMLIALLRDSNTDQQGKLVIYKLKLVTRVVECVEVSSTSPGAALVGIEKLRAVVAGQVIYLHTSARSSSMLSFDTVNRQWGRMQLPPDLKGGDMHVFSYHGPVLRTKLSQGLARYKQPSPVATLVLYAFSFLFIVVFYFLSW